MIALESGNTLAPYPLATDRLIYVSYATDNECGYATVRTTRFLYTLPKLLVRS